MRNELITMRANYRIDSVYFTECEFEDLEEVHIYKIETKEINIIIMTDYQARMRTAEFEYLQIAIDNIIDVFNITNYRIYTLC